MCVHVYMEECTCWEDVCTCMWWSEVNFCVFLSFSPPCFLWGRVSHWPGLLILLACSPVSKPQRASCCWDYQHKLLWPVTPVTLWKWLTPSCHPLCFRLVLQTVFLTSSLVGLPLDSSTEIIFLSPLRVNVAPATLTSVSAPHKYSRTSSLDFLCSC